MPPTSRHSPVAEILAAADAVILGKSTQTRLALCCLLAKGHLLIEDLPGVGKTTLAHTLARLLGFQFSRVQFTSDMLPADILGVSVFDRDRGDFRFLPGPVFAQGTNIAKQTALRQTFRLREARPLASFKTEQPGNRSTA